MTATRDFSSLTNIQQNVAALSQNFQSRYADGFAHVRERVCADRSKDFCVRTVNEPDDILSTCHVPMNSKTEQNGQSTLLCHTDKIS